MYRAKHLRSSRREYVAPHPLYREEYMGAEIGVAGSRVMVTTYVTKPGVPWRVYHTATSEDYGVTWKNDGVEWPMDIYEAARRAGAR